MTTGPEIVGQFAELFEGSESATGTEEGGCDRTPTTHEARIAQHLGDGPPIGIYPMAQVLFADRSTGWGVKFGCVDFDEGEDKSYADATKLQSALAVVGVTSWVERSRSKGYHVWIFCTDWVRAEAMRNALLYVSSIVDTPVKEVNPKQVTLEDGQLGNYIRLPFPMALAASDFEITFGPPDDTRRVVIAQDGHPMSVSVFASRALNSRVAPSAIEAIAARYTPPQRPIRERVEHDWDDEDVDELISQLTKYERHIWRNGAYEGGDRSKAMYKLCSLLYENHDDLDRSEAFAILKAMPDNKFRGRADEALRINRIIDTVWNR